MQNDQVLSACVMCTDNVPAKTYIENAQKCDYSADQFMNVSTKK